MFRRWNAKKHYQVFYQQHSALGPRSSWHACVHCANFSFLFLVLSRNMKWNINNCRNRPHNLLQLSANEEAKWAKFLPPVGDYSSRILRHEAESLIVRAVLRVARAFKKFSRMRQWLNLVRMWCGLVDSSPVDSLDEASPRHFRRVDDKTFIFRVLFRDIENYGRRHKSWMIFGKTGSGM